MSKKTKGSQCVTHMDYVAYCKAPLDGELATVVLADQEYPGRVGLHVAQLAMARFQELQAGGTLPDSDSTLHGAEFEALLAKSQTPDEVDDVEKIRRDLDETQETLHTTIKDLLERGEKLDDLADQSEDLGVFSREFLKKSESMNQCCLLVRIGLFCFLFFVLYVLVWVIFILYCLKLKTNMINCLFFEKNKIAVNI